MTQNVSLTENEVALLIRLISGMSEKSLRSSELKALHYKAKSVLTLARSRGEKFSFSIEGWKET